MRESKNVAKMQRPADHKPPSERGEDLTDKIISIGKNESHEPELLPLPCRHLVVRHLAYTPVVIFSMLLHCAKSPSSSSHRPTNSC